MSSRGGLLCLLGGDMTVTVFADGRGEARGRGARRRVVNVPKEGDACQGVMLM